MPVPDCQLITSSRDARVEQIHTGLFELHRTGRIRLRQTVSRPGPEAGGVHPGFVKVVLDRSVRLHFDLADGGEINPAALDGSDFYFKRSFDPAVVATLPGGGEKIHPLGLNFPVYPNHRDPFSFRRILALEKAATWPAEWIRWADTGNRFSFLPRERFFGGEPDYGLPPKVLFLVRAWDPYDRQDRPQDKIDGIHAVNETRAACIRVLRDAFGDRFLGGFSHTDFARQHYPDVLAPSAALTTKRSYIELLSRFPICVATTGLHGSIGWKVGEYTGLGKAIVSEKLCYQVPGNFVNGRNFLEFSTPEECANRVETLCSDDALRRKMMAENLQYYQQWVRPDQLVWNALQTALSS